MSQSLWSRDGFSIESVNFTREQGESQSLWSRDGFSITCATRQNCVPMSQSLCSREGFSITSWTLSDCAVSRNPFGAGTVFQWDFFINLNDKQRRNPFGAGTVFQYYHERVLDRENMSQSLWSRDGFSIYYVYQQHLCYFVAIPLEQGRFFNSEVCFSFLFLGYQKGVFQLL